MITSLNDDETTFPPALIDSRTNSFFFFFCLRVSIIQGHEIILSYKAQSCNKTRPSPVEENDERCTQLARVHLLQAKINAPNNVHNVQHLFIAGHMTIAKTAQSVA